MKGGSYSQAEGWGKGAPEVPGGCEPPPRYVPRGALGAGRDGSRECHAAQTTAPHRSSTKRRQGTRPSPNRRGPLSVSGRLRSSQGGPSTTAALGQLQPAPFRCALQLRVEVPERARAPCVTVGKFQNRAGNFAPRGAPGSVAVLSLRYWRRATGYRCAPSRGNCLKNGPFPSDRLLDTPHLVAAPSPARGGLATRGKTALPSLNLHHGKPLAGGIV